MDLEKLIDGLAIHVPMQQTIRVEFDGEGMAYGYASGQTHWVWMMPREDYEAIMAEMLARDT